jgi:hypothetical protein
VSERYKIDGNALAVLETLANQLSALVAWKQSLPPQNRVADHRDLHGATSRPSECAGDPMRRPRGALRAEE